MSRRTMILAAVVYGATAASWFGLGRAWQRAECARTVLALDGARIAREGKTDRAFYLAHPDQLAGGVSKHVKR